MAGIYLVSMSLDPKVGKIIILDSIFQCLSSALIMASTTHMEIPLYQ